MAIDNKKMITLLVALNAITLLAVALLVGLLLGQRSNGWSPPYSESVPSGKSLPATGAGPQEGRMRTSSVGEQTTPQPQRPQQEMDQMLRQDETPSAQVVSQSSSSVGAAETNQMLPTMQGENNVDPQVAEPATVPKDTRELQQTVSDWQSDKYEYERNTEAKLPGDEAEGSGSKVDVFYSGSMVRIEEVDERGNKLVSISNTMYDVEELAAGDQAYLAALDELKNGTRSHISIKKPEDAKRAASEVTGSQVERANYYNKVNLNEQQPEDGNRSSLAARIESIVSGETSSPVKKPENSGTQRPRRDQSTNTAAYVQALKKEHVERANEMRTIRVRAGDSLWKIAEKAYGDGFAYKRLIAANPHLTNPDLLNIGDLVRVPL